MNNGERIKKIVAIGIITVVCFTGGVLVSRSNSNKHSSGETSSSIQDNITDYETYVSDTKQQTNSNHNTNVNSQSNSIQTEPSNSQQNTNTATQTVPLTQTEITTSSPKYVVIDTNTFSGNLVSEKQENEYQFTPNISGKYRFDFDINDVQCDYRFYMYAPDGTELASTYSSNGGKTVDLTANTTYTIVIRQYSGFPSYSITIGIPNVSKVIEGMSFSGSITYKDQEDIYTYTAPKTGRYRFDFSTDNVQSDYKFYMYASNKSELASTYCSNGGKTVDLNAGETYTIKVKQYAGTPNYSITIGEPNESMTINGTSFSGSITYKDQEDIYTYIAPKSGRYRFDFNSDNVQNEYKFYMYASNNSEIASTYYSNGGKTVDLNAGESYTIKVKQYSGTENYTITIGVPNDPNTIFGTSFSGNLTFKDQEDIYTYIAPVTGQYIFDFNSNDVQSEYKFIMHDANNSELASTYYSNGNKKVELIAGETYTIIVRQYSGTSQYEIIINEP